VPAVLERNAAAPAASAPFPADRPLRRGRALFFLAAGAGAFAFAHILASSDHAAGGTLFGAIGSALSRPLSIASGLLPIALGEFLLVVYVVWIGVAAARALRLALVRRRRWRNVLAGGGCRVARDGGIVLIAFYLLWGLNYARPVLADGAPWPQWSDVPPAERVALAERTLEAANRAYVDLHGTTDAGRPTALPAGARTFEAAVDTGWANAARMLALPEATARGYGRVKWPWISPLIARFGITGVYFPFTAEANVVRGLPAVVAGQTMAHEKAHQRGVASEAEASFLGFVAGSLAPHPLSRYAAAVFAHGQMMSALRVAARDDWRRIAASRHPGVQRDLEDVSAYFLRYRGVARAVGGAVNDRYLRANGVRDGSGSYASSALILVAFARRHGGDPMPAWREQTSAPD
jgi:hypothetical protein